MKSDQLDLEFALKRKKWVLFQCRELPNKNLKKFEDKTIDNTLFNLKKKIEKIKKRNQSLRGSTTFLSNMVDWNPAEMIGDKPKNLAISLYSKLITDNVWSNKEKLWI